MLYDFVHERRIAYFSMEIALRSEIPTYAGGLGVLAGDTLRAAADLAVPMAGVTLEGHAALLTLELLHQHAYAPAELRPGERLYDVPKVRAHCIFTTHTPVEAGYDQFSYELVERLLENRIGVETLVRLADPARAVRSRLAVNESEIDLDVLKRFAGEDRLNMTRLALNLSDYVNGVAKRHAEVSQQMFPGYRVHAITNGVHPSTWTAAPFAKVYDQYLPAWRHEPEQLVRADCCIPDAAILAAHAQAKAALIDKVRADTGVSLRPDVLLLGFARRMTAYKRPDLLFTDLERLKRIAREQPLQIVLAGKAHPRDGEGKRLIEMLHAHARALAGAIPVAYLHDYDMAAAQLLVAGVDVWVNTPLPPMEASGTSGMKAAFNGVPSLSVLDGWWIEGCIEGVTGWSVGTPGAQDDARSLYDKLQRVVLPLYRAGTSGGDGWINVMKGAISKNATYFNSHRMMRRYIAEAYLR